MGSPADEPDAKPTEQPQRMIQISQGFWIGETPITQTQWQTVMGAPPPLHEPEAAGDALPAEGMNWRQARLFGRRLTTILRESGWLAANQLADLPSEAQWEYACRARTRTRWYFGDDPTKLVDHAWFAANSQQRKQPVKRKLANPWGLYDLYGNVAEWCRDDFGRYTAAATAVIDPLFVAEDSVLKIARGGAFSYPAVECRSASREAIHQDNPFNEPAGLRIVLVESIG